MKIKTMYVNATATARGVLQKIEKDKAWGWAPGSKFHNECLDAVKKAEEAANTDFGRDILTLTQQALTKKYEKGQVTFVTRLQEWELMEALAKKVENAASCLQNMHKVAMAASS